MIPPHVFMQTTARNLAKFPLPLCKYGALQAMSTVPWEAIKSSIVIRPWQGLQVGCSALRATVPLSDARDISILNSLLSHCLRH